MLFNNVVSYGGGGCPGNMIIFLNGKFLLIDKIEPWQNIAGDPINTGYFFYVCDDRWQDIPIDDFFKRRLQFQFKEIDKNSPFDRYFIKIIDYEVFKKDDNLKLRLSAKIDDNQGSNRLTKEEVEYIKSISENMITKFTRFEIMDI